jgi:hypothetical protein
MRKSLIAAAVTSTLCFSAPFAMAQTGGVSTILQAEIDVLSSSDTIAKAENRGGSGSEVDAEAAVVSIRNDASDGTSIRSQMDLDIDVISTGDITATAENIGGNNNDVSATAAVIAITNESSRR